MNTHKNMNACVHWDYSYRHVGKDNTKKTNDEIFCMMETHEFYLGDIRDLVPMFVKIRKDTNLKVADVGGGIGAFAERLRRIAPGHEYHLLDISKEAVDICKDLFPEIIATCGDMEKLPYDSDGFDFIISSQSIEHVTDIDKCLFEVFRCLKKNGLFVSIFPYKWPVDGDHNYSLDDDYVYKTLAKYGDIVEYKDSFQYRSKIAIIKK